MFACAPVFARGTGLGNRLFQWARAVIYARRHDLPVLSPTFFRPTVTALRLGGVDIHNYWRQILLMDLFQPGESYISGIAKLQYLLSSEWLPEPDNLSADPPKAPSSGRFLIRFSGRMGQFKPLIGEHVLVRDELEAITKPKWLRLAERNAGAVIGVNIRRAKDFTDAASADDYIYKGAIRTPLDWFCRSISRVRELLGFCARAIVVTDGTEKDLAPVLALPNISILRPGCAISDLHVLSRTKILIASGGSSFSAWASYLGQIPTLTIPGQSLSWFDLSLTNGAYLGDFDPDKPSQEVDRQIAELGLILSR